VIFNKPFGPYTLVKKLATGGMAEVYLALKRRPAPFARTLALKCHLEHLNERAELVEMFYYEARLGGLLQHPNLIQVFDAARIDGRHTMVMEFVPGHTVEAITERLASRKEPIELRHALSIVAGAAAGLDHAHKVRDVDGTELRIVHRDVSPANVLVGYDGLARVFDFGVAIAAGRGDASGELAGKTAYMSPEQCRGRSVDARSDVFALGIVLHELLTGQRLFLRENQIKTIRAVTEDEIPVPSSIRTDLPDALDKIVLRALERNPDSRYSSALELFTDLDDFIHAADLATPAEETGRWLQFLFDEHVAETKAVIEKALMAPEQNEATVDLATFDLRTTRSLQALEAKAISSEQGDGLDALKTDAVAPILAPALAEQANQAMAEKLRTAQRMSRIFLVTTLLGILTAALVILSQITEPESDTSNVVAASATTVAAVVVESAPTAARIRVNGELREELTPTQLVLDAGTPISIDLELDGYVAFSGSITPVAQDPPQRLSHTFVVDPESPAAPIGSVRAIFTPEDATVFLDSEQREGGSPVEIDGLTLNRTYTLRFERAGYEPLYHAFRLDSGERLDIQLALAEALELGTVNIRSNPPGAAVLINDTETGTTPIEGLELVANQTYTIEVAASGYTRWRRQIRVRPDTVEDLEANLERPSRRDDSPRDRTGSEPSSGGTGSSTAEPSRPEPTRPTYELID
jgi:serine/threonine protein kinase